MSAVAAKRSPQTAPLPNLAAANGQHVVIEDIDWSAYEMIGEALRDRANIRLTYDRGRLEIMTLSAEHERLKALLGSLILILAEETELQIGSFGSTTYKRDVLERGLEPDQCYYHRNFDRVRAVRRIDLSRDPPPDLAVEIDVTSSSLDRMAIYSALGVAELWRLEGETLSVYQLTADGRYEPTETSPTFPGVPIASLVPFLQIGLDQGDTSMIRAARAWVRERLARP